MTRDEQRVAANQRARRFAAALGIGVTAAALARQVGCSRTWIMLALRSACPPFKGGPVPKPRLKADPRPSWSYPDQTTLRIARETRADMQARGGVLL